MATTIYGGNHLKYAQPNYFRPIRLFQYVNFLCRYASNIVFSNGLLDPWSGGGVLRSETDKITIIIIPDAAHHLDLRAAHPNDPGSVQSARNIERTEIKKWLSINEFY